MPFHWINNINISVKFIRDWNYQTICDFNSFLLEYITNIWYLLQGFGSSIGDFFKSYFVKGVSIIWWFLMLNYTSHQIIFRNSKFLVLKILGSQMRHVYTLRRFPLRCTTSYTIFCYYYYGKITNMLTHKIDASVTVLIQVWVSFWISSDILHIRMHMTWHNIIILK